MVNPLARVVMNNVVKKTSPNKNIGLKDRENKVNNLTHREEDLIVGVINEGKKIKEEKDTVTMLTLDEAVERIKGSR